MASAETIQGTCATHCRTEIAEDSEWMSWFKHELDIAICDIKRAAYKMWKRLDSFSAHKVCALRELEPLQIFTLNQPSPVNFPG